MMKTFSRWLQEHPFVGFSGGGIRRFKNNDAQKSPIFRAFGRKYGTGDRT